MSSKSTCPFNRARDIRNAILHSSKLELDGPTLGYYLDTFITVLLDAKCLLNCHGSKQAVDKLSKLKNQQINISREDEKALLKSRKEALSELDEKTTEGLREIDNRTATALCDIEKDRLGVKRNIQEEKRIALSDLDEARRKAREEVHGKTKAAQSDIEQARKRARLDIEEWKETSLSEIKDAKYHAIDGMKQQQSSIVLPGGEESSAPLYSFQTSTSLSEGVATYTGLHFPLSAVGDVYLKRKTQMKDDLITFYKDRHSTIPLSPLFEEHDTPLLDFYVLPQMNEVQKMFSLAEEIKTPIKLLSDVFKSGSNRSREIYLTADAGFGKTAFSKYMAVTWCQAHRPDDKYTEYFSEDSINAMREYEFLFLVLLRDSSEVCSIDDLIVNQIVQNLSRSSCLEMDSLQEILHSERCLVILDGLDEWTHTENKCPKVPKTIPHRNAREKCTILTTTRPWKLSAIKLNSRQVDKRVELVKLTSESEQTLTEKAISKIKDLDLREAKILAKSLKENIKKNGLENLESVPLLLMYLIFLWCDDVPLGQSKCGLYTSIIELLLSRTISKYPEMEPTFGPFQSDIPQCFSEHVQCKKNCTFLKALGKLAWETLMSENKESTLVFDHSVTEKNLNPSNLKLSLLSGILTLSKEKVKLTKQTSKASFSHKTVQEYFCALYISCQNERDAKNIILQNCSRMQSILDMSTVFTFISGMNAKIMSSISRELMSVVSTDKITRIYRSLARYDYRYVYPVKDIQKMYISCFKENPNNNDLKLCFQDVIIDKDCREDSHFTSLKQLAIHNKNNIESISIKNTGVCSLHQIIDSCDFTDFNNIRKIFYKGECKEEDILRLLNRSVEYVTIVSNTWQDGHFIDKRSSCSSELCKTVQNMSQLQAIFIESFEMDHDVLEEFLNYIINRKSMTQIGLYRLYCVTHHSFCPGYNLDLSQHSALRALGLHDIPVSELKVNISALETCEVGRLSKPGVVTSYLGILPEACKLQGFKCSYLESFSDIETMLQALPLMVQVKDVWLADINLGERSLPLSPEMINIRYVLLWRVTMSATALRNIVTLLEKLPRL